MKFNSLVLPLATLRDLTKPVIAGVILVFCAGCQTQSALKGLANQPLDGFEPHGKVVFYDSDSLFEYINGEAMIYLDQGFQKLQVFSFRSRETGRLYTVDAYDLGVPENATAVHNELKTRHSEPIAGLGSQATTDGLTVQMHHGTHFIRIQAAQDVANPSREELAALAKALFTTMSE